MKLRGRISYQLVIKRIPMISVGFKRVSKTRPCRICGKPTYCGFSRDEGTSICMRISAGVPGFWQEPSGVVHIWKPHNYLMPLLVVPYKDANGLIQACQIRLQASDILSDEKRYFWLSSTLERHGTSSGITAHNHRNTQFVRHKVKLRGAAHLCGRKRRTNTASRFIQITRYTEFGRNNLLMSSPTPESTLRDYLLDGDGKRNLLCRRGQVPRS
jgi:hypothetical protein